MTVPGREASRSPTIKEVARRAGVALSSVSRVLNEHPDVSPAMRTRVLEAVAELGYEPDLLASGLRRGTTRTIGFVVADIVNPLFARILTGAERYLRQAGYSVLLAHSEGDPDRDVEATGILRRRRVDGLILSLADDTREETAAELLRLDMPIVLLDREVQGLPNMSAVLADHRTGILRATKHLLTLGHRRIALITGPLHTRPGRERIAGFREGFERHDLPVPEDLMHPGSFAKEFGERTADELLDSDEPPTAFIAGGNLIFVGTVAALHRRGLRIGEDIALITCDDVPLAEFHTPPITVVRRDTDAMGALAARMLLERLGGEVEATEQRIETLPTELVLRESTFPINP